MHVGDNTNMGEVLTGSYCIMITCETQAMVLAKRHISHHHYRYKNIRNHGNNLVSARWFFDDMIYSRNAHIHPSRAGRCHAPLRYKK
jgi:hypothetical protein